jgi:hypothetical protein
VSLVARRLRAARCSLGTDRDEEAIDEVIALQHLNGLLRRHPAGHVTEGLALLAALLDTRLGPRELVRRLTRWADEIAGEGLARSEAEEQLLVVAEAARGQS